MVRKGFWVRLSRLADCLVVIVALIWLFILTCVALVFGWDMTKSELSGWMQTLGSLMGLAIAVWLPWRESLRRREGQLAKERAYARRLFYAAYEIWGQISGLFNELEFVRNYDREVSSAIFERFLARLNSSFDDDPHPDRVKLVHELRQNLPGLLGYLKHGASDENSGGKRIFELRGYYCGVCRNCWDHLANLEAVLPPDERTVRPVDF